MSQVYMRCPWCRTAHRARKYYEAWTVFCCGLWHDRHGSHKLEV